VGRGASRGGVARGASRVGRGGVSWGVGGVSWGVGRGAWGVGRGGVGGVAAALAQSEHSVHCEFFREFRLTSLRRIVGYSRKGIHPPRGGQAGKRVTTPH
jgi:hypothetical protein